MGREMLGWKALSAKVIPHNVRQWVATGRFQRSRLEEWRGTASLARSVKYYRGRENKLQGKKKPKV